MFRKLGLRYLCVVEEGSGRLVGVGHTNRSRCRKHRAYEFVYAGHHQERLVVWLESMKH